MWRNSSKQSWSVLFLTPRVDVGVDQSAAVSFADHLQVYWLDWHALVVLLVVSLVVLLVVFQAWAIYPAMNDTPAAETPSTIARLFLNQEYILLVYSSYYYARIWMCRWQLFRNTTIDTDCICGDRPSGSPLKVSTMRYNNRHWVCHVRFPIHDEDMKAASGLSKCKHTHTWLHNTNTQHTCSGDCIISIILHYGGWVHCGSSTGQLLMTLVNW